MEKGEKVKGEVEGVESELTDIECESDRGDGRNRTTDSMAGRTHKRQKCAGARCSEGSERIPLVGEARSPIGLVRKQQKCREKKLRRMKGEDEKIVRTSVR